MTTYLDGSNTQVYSSTLKVGSTKMESFEQFPKRANSRIEGYCTYVCKEIYFTAAFSTTVGHLGLTLAIAVCT